MVQSAAISGIVARWQQDIACFVIKALLRIIVTDLLNGVADDFLVVEPGFCGDLSEDHDHARLGGSLTGDLGKWILFKHASSCVIEKCVGKEVVNKSTIFSYNGIRNLITNLIWMKQ